MIRCAYSTAHTLSHVAAVVCVLAGVADPAVVLGVVLFWLLLETRKAQPLAGRRKS